MEILRKYALFTLLLAFVGTWSLACGSSSDGDGDADGDADGDGDGDADGDNELQFASDESVFLRYGETAELAVRYSDPEGAPIVGAQISYSVINGEPMGSSLPASRAQTDGTGVASMVLTAGTSNTTFQVQTTPPAGDPIAFSVTVSDTEVGTIRIRMSYEGEQTFAEFRPYLWIDQACAEIDPDSPPTAELAGAAVERLTDRPEFAGLEPASNYTVGVIAIVDGAAQGFGCNQGVSVEGNDVTEVEMTLVDIDRPIQWDGTYDLESYLDFADVLPPSVEAATSVFDELTDDEDGDRSPTDTMPLGPNQAGQDPGAFLVDIVMRQTCHWECLPGEDDYDECSEVNHAWGDLYALYDENFQDWDDAQSRFFGGCGAWEFIAQDVQEYVNDLIASSPTLVSVTNIVNIIGDLARAINRAHIYSVMTVDEETEDGWPFEHVLTEMEVRLRDIDGTYHDYRFDLADAGMTSLAAEEIASSTGDELTIPDHAFVLHFGHLLQYIYLEGVLPLLGYESTAEILQEWVDCEDVGQWLYDQAVALAGGLSDLVPSAAQLEEYCNLGLEVGGSELEDLIVDLVDEESTLVLAGSVLVGAIDDEYHPTDLIDGVWEGEWTEGAFTGDVTGDFTGARR